MGITSSSKEKGRESYHTNPVDGRRGINKTDVKEVVCACGTEL